MRRIISLIIGIAAGTGVAYASVPVYYDYALTPVHNSILYSEVDLIDAKILAFDYWYDPDPYPENPDLIKNSGIPQNMTVKRYDSADPYQHENMLGRSDFLQPSTQWRSLTYQLPADFSGRMACQLPELEISMQVMANSYDWLYYGLSGPYDPENERILNNRIFLSDFRTYASLDDYYCNTRWTYPGDDVNNGSSQPVPEPATLAMLGVSLAGLIYRKRIQLNRTIKGGLWRSLK